MKAGSTEINEVAPLYAYQAGQCKYFPLDDVRISRMMKFSLMAMRRENAVMIDSIEVLHFITDQALWRLDCQSVCGATRYQVVNSTTVSGGCQGEEDNRHNIQALQAIPRL